MPSFAPTVSANSVAGPVNCPSEANRSLSPAATAFQYSTIMAPATGILSSQAGGAGIPLSRMDRIIRVRFVTLSANVATTTANGAIRTRVTSPVISEAARVRLPFVSRTIHA